MKQQNKSVHIYTLLHTLEKIQLATGLSLHLKNEQSVKFAIIESA